METTKKIVWQVWALIAVVFVLGTLTGASVISLYHTRRAAGSASEKHGGPRRGMIEKMKQELNLTDEQAVQIQALMEESRKDFRAAFDACPQLKETRDKTAARIRPLLTAEQQQKFDELRARRDEERKQK
jgi:Spy/CpxP family protein refolding chaperone